MRFAYDPSAEIVVAVLGVAFGAFCIFLMIRIIGRRKRSGLRFWVTALFAALIAYPLSRGPVAWLSWHDKLPRWADAPLDYLLAPLYRSPKPIRDALARYERLWMPSLVSDDTSPDRLSPEEIQALRDEFAESPPRLDDFLDPTKRDDLLERYDRARATVGR